MASSRARAGGPLPAALLLLLASAAAWCPRGASALELPTTCPVNRAHSCYLGQLPSTAAAPTPVPYSVSTTIDFLNTQGLNYSRSEVGLCSTLTYTCNAALAAVFAADATWRAAVSGFAGACLNRSATPPMFIASNLTYTGYGAFTQADCSRAIAGFNAALFYFPQLFGAAVQSFELCDADNCNMPPPASGAARGAGRGGAAAAAIAIALAAGTALAAALV